jgi:predicted transcriptional regulator
MDGASCGGFGELAQLAGISRITIQKAEHGEAVRGNMAGKICRVLSEKLERRITYKEAQITIL